MLRLLLVMERCRDCNAPKEKHYPTGEPQCPNPECHCYLEVAREYDDEHPHDELTITN